MDKYIYCCNTIAFFFLLKRGKIPGIKLLTAEKWHQWDKALFFSPLLHIYMFVIRQGKTCVSTLNHSLMLVVSVRITFPSFAFQLTCYSFFHPLCLHSDSSLNRFFFLSCKLVTNGIDNLKNKCCFLIKRHPWPLVLDPLLCINHCSCSSMKGFLLNQCFGKVLKLPSLPL